MKGGRTTNVDWPGRQKIAERIKNEQ